MCKTSTSVIQTDALPVRYVLVEDNPEVPGLPGCRSFGIAAIQGTETLAMVHDVTTDEVLAYSLAERCTRLALSPIHLRDLAEDVLNA